MKTKLLANTLDAMYLQNILKVIEYSGRVCYNSVDKIGDGTAEIFIEKVLNINKHESVGGHSFFSFYITLYSGAENVSLLAKSLAFDIINGANGNIQVDIVGDSNIIVGGNWRSFTELANKNIPIGILMYSRLQNYFNKKLFSHGLYSDDLYLQEIEKYYQIKSIHLYYPQPNEDKELFYRYNYATILFTGVDRALTHQMVRHMGVWLKNSYSQESQRYVRVDIDSSPFIYPDFSGDIESYNIFSKTVNECKSGYESLLVSLKSNRDKYDQSIKVEEMARGVLPNCTPTKIVMSATIESWVHFLKMRMAKNAQSPIRALANDVYKILNDAGFHIDDIDV